MILQQVDKIYSKQLYLTHLYKALFSTAYFGLFRVGELTKGDHPVLARNIHIGRTKKKILFVLRSSKTHWKDQRPQLIKIASKVSPHGINNVEREELPLPCPFELLRAYLKARESTYIDDNEPFFIFRNRMPAIPLHFRTCLMKGTITHIV